MWSYACLGTIKLAVNNFNYIALTLGISHMIWMITAEILWYPHADIGPGRNAT